MINERPLSQTLSHVYSSCIRIRCTTTLQPSTNKPPPHPSPKSSFCVPDVVAAAYDPWPLALKGSALYALTLIPVTCQTRKLLDSLSWDLRFRGPSEASLGRFLLASEEKLPFLSTGLSLKQSTIQSRSPSVDGGKAKEMNSAVSEPPSNVLRLRRALSMAGLPCRQQVGGVLDVVDIVPDGMGVGYDLVK